MVDWPYPTSMYSRIYHYKTCVIRDRSRDYEVLLHLQLQFLILVGCRCWTTMPECDATGLATVESERQWRRPVAWFMWRMPLGPDRANALAIHHTLQTRGAHRRYCGSPVMSARRTLITAQAYLSLGYTLSHSPPDKLPDTQVYIPCSKLPWETIIFMFKSNNSHRTIRRLVIQLIDIVLHNTFLNLTSGDLYKY